MGFAWINVGVLAYLLQNQIVLFIMLYVIMLEEKALALDPESVPKFLLFIRRKPRNNMRLRPSIQG